MRTKEQWKALVSEFESSDLIQAQFCRQKKISSSGLHKWRKYYAESITNSDFIDISQPLSSQSHPVIPQDNNTAWQVELELGKGIILRVRTA